MTFRAVDTLKQVSLIACEDTRVSAKLLQHYDISTPTISYNDHNGGRQRPRLFDKLRAGESVALISDAGTPLISDPGYKLVEEAHSHNITIVPIPGASSVITALCACGLPTDQFHFVGFLPNKSKARTDSIAAIADVPGTLVFLESPKRISKTLVALQEGLGNRQAVVARELTKRYEELRTGSLAELIAQYENEPTPKGEIVLIVAPAEKQEISAEDIDQLLQDAMQSMSTKEAASSISKQCGVGKSELYQRALQLK